MNLLITLLTIDGGQAMYKLNRCYYILNLFGLFAYTMYLYTYITNEYPKNVGDPCDGTMTFIFKQICLWIVFLFTCLLGITYEYVWIIVNFVIISKIWTKKMLY